MMRDPERIIQGHANDEAVLLMRAARRDAPSAQSRLRTLAALGLPTTLSVVGKAATAAALLTSSKGLLTGAIVGVALGSALATIAVSSSQPSSGARPAQSQQAGAVASMRAHDQKAANSAAPTATDAAPVASTASPPLPTGVGLERARPAERAAQAKLEKRPATSPLAREVAALDVVRAAALEQQYGRVLTLLDAYQHAFPQGALQPEAQVLRVEALARSGQLNRARTLAERLLAADPSGPLSHRIRMATPSSDTCTTSTTNSRSDSNSCGISH